MSEEKKEEVQPEIDDAIRTEVVNKVQAILDEYGYALGVAGFIVVKK